MSTSPKSSTPPPEADPDDPLCITEHDRKQHFKESEATKRKSAEDEPDGSVKKQKTEDCETKNILNSNVESNDSGHAPDSQQQSRDDEDEEKEEPLSPDDEVNETSKDDFDMDEKLKTMSEISFKPIVKSEKEDSNKMNEETDDNVTVEISKKEKRDQQERKVQNLRKNIKEVIDESHLDATTLAAQRQESERLARVQEQQRLIRDAQRQMAAEKQANKTQQKVLSLLQGESSDPASSSTIDLDDPILEKFTLSSAVTITPAAKAALQSIQSLISTEDQMPDSSESDDDDVVIQPDEPQDKSKAVMVDSSSDSDDCIILSDEEEEDVEDDDEGNSGEHTNDVYNQKDNEGRVVVNVGHGEKESNIYIAPQIARVIKPHQIGGVRFLFDNIIESIELFDKSTGFGCILAHSMGLGKTLQLVCFCDIFLRHTNSKSVLIIMPINTLQNWLHEFNMWLPLPEDAEKSPLNAGGEVRPRHFKIFVLNDSQKTLSARAKTVLEWSKEGGVLMMGYEIYRLLSLKKLKPKKKRGSFASLDSDVSSNDQKMFDEIHAALVDPGPDLIVCDEGHRIKNAHASTSLALKQIKSKRRIVLTGYPLQNNLLEYWCMVDFVRPSYLGTKTEFSNMFERPILNGQCIDSTPQDCKLMRYRAHVLHSLLKGFVQRRSQTVLQKSLPTKTEFVMLIRMTQFQRKLYNVFMDEVVRSKKVPNPLKAFSVCCKIWNHPDVLYNFLKKREELDLDIELEDSESLAKSEQNTNSKKRGRKSKTSPKKEADKKKTDKIEAKECLEPVKLEPHPKLSTESFKPLIKPSSNDSAYSSNQSMRNNFDSTTSQYPNYEGGSYQNYNYNNSNSNGYWTGENYWQNNYYQNDYSQNYYQQNSYQNYYGNSTYQSFDQKQSMPKAEPTEDKTVSATSNVPNDRKLEGGLLADVIKEEAKELLDKDSKEPKDEFDTKELVLPKSSRDDGIPYDWAPDLMKDYVSDLVENSPKMEIFLCILEESIKLGDRLLVFSQSLLTLNLLERFLQKAKIPDTDSNWAKNVSYFRLDGSTAALEREKLINEFNSNSKVKLFLVSTRAGSLGINLVGANRVVVFDASWNPCHDTQAVCRVYRYGQSKSCFVYRFVMDNCLEKKIYDRQINKQGMADRVVDECNPDAHLSMREVTSLCYDDGVDPDVSDFKDKIDKYEDFVAKKILQLHAKSLTKEPFQHESLLVDRKEKKLSLAEKRLAQRGYEMEKQAATKPPTFNYNSVGTNYRAYRTPDGSIVHRPVASVRPMRNDFGENISPVRPTIPRPNRWVPVEVWQSKGLTAQEMTLPQDVSIQTNAADKSKIYLKAGQKVIVLKSPKGICLQLESGKVIAIRASMKGGQQNPGLEQKLGSFSEGSQSSTFRPNFPPRNVSDVIDISNDDDDDVPPVRPKVSSLPAKIQPQMENLKVSSTETTSIKPVETPVDPVYKEKVVYKPNLVPRKPKLSATQLAPPKDIQPIKPYEPGFQSQRRPTPPTWSTNKNYPNSIPSSAPGYRSTNGATLKPPSAPLIIESENITAPQPMPRDQHIDASAFHSASSDPIPYAPQHYNQTNVYQNAPYSNHNYPPAHGSSGYNYPYHPSYPNTPTSYHYQPQASANVPYDPNYGQDFNSSNYNTAHPFPPQINTEPTQQAPYPTPPSNYSQWNYNGQ